MYIYIYICIHMYSYSVHLEKDFESGVLEMSKCVVNTFTIIYIYTSNVVRIDKHICHM